MPNYELNYEGNTQSGFSGEGYGIFRALQQKRVPNLLRKGYKMTGWYKEPECRTKVDPDVNGDATYYAGWTPWTEEDKAQAADYMKRAERIKYLMARPTAFDWDSFLPFFRHAIRLVFEMEGQHCVLEESVRELEKAEAAAKDLVQLCDPEETCWYLWGDNMPQSKDVASADFFYEFDYPSFRPFLIPYLLKDQARVKGNLIAIAGGGYSQRWNQSEGYAIAKAFNQLGYNAFVLQRRLQPWAKEDCFIDLQRAVRYLKYYAAEKGIGAIENIATAGFSGGGGTIIGQLEEFYSHELPTKLYPDYVPDEIDAVDADYKVAMPIYGGFGLGDTKNTHLPAMFFAVGAKDHLMLNPALGRHSFGRFFEMMKEHPEIDLELHVFADTPHGFGTARGEDKDIHDHMGTVGTDRWIELAEDFMMVNFGIIDRHYAMGHRPGLGF